MIAYGAEAHQVVFIASQGLLLRQGEPTPRFSEFERRLARRGRCARWQSANHKMTRAMVTAKSHRIEPFDAGRNGQQSGSDHSPPQSTLTPCILMPRARLCFVVNEKS